MWIFILIIVKSTLPKTFKDIILFIKQIFTQISMNKTKTFTSESLRSSDRDKSKTKKQGTLFVVDKCDGKK